MLVYNLYNLQKSKVVELSSGELHLLHDDRRGDESNRNDMLSFELQVLALLCTHFLFTYAAVDVPVTDLDHAKCLHRHCIFVGRYC